jgi:hypothetical protein
MLYKSGKVSSEEAECRILTIGSSGGILKDETIKYGLGLQDKYSYTVSGFDNSSGSAIAINMYEDETLLDVGYIVFANGSVFENKFFGIDYDPEVFMLEREYAYAYGVNDKRICGSQWQINGWRHGKGCSFGFEMNEDITIEDSYWGDSGIRLTSMDNYSKYNSLFFTGQIGEAAYIAMELHEGSIDENEVDKEPILKIQPNITDGSVELISDQRLGEIDLYNASGKLIIGDVGLGSVNMTGLPAGMYFFEYFHNGRPWAVPVVVR